MPGGGAHFSSVELAEVLSHYNIGVIHQVRPLNAGNKRAPKMVITSEKGQFLLKRRPRGKDDLYRVAFAHAVQTHLSKKRFPVAALMVTCDEKNTILHLDSHIYELFQFISGTRYDGTADATIDTGRQLAKFHEYLTDFASEWKPLKGSFHDSSIVRRQLKAICAEKMAGQDKRLQEIAEKLMSLYNNSSVRVNEHGFDSWPEQVVHGDWHPGNMLFSKNKIIAVIDFDSVKVASAVTDLANGMLQFSIVGNRPNPADWPDYLDQSRLAAFLNGYHEVIKLDKNKYSSLLDLMIETIVAEAVLPIAATGFFGNLSGVDFLRMIRRKAEWIEKNRDKLAEEIRG